MLGALTDAALGPAVARRLDATFAKFFGDQITLVGEGGSSQSTAAGLLGQLTKEQTNAILEMERLLSGARRSATLAFPKGDVRSHAEFQVGVNEPQDLGSELERARKTATACATHAAEIAAHGWLAEDTTALNAAIGTVTGAYETHDKAGGKKGGLTTAHNRAASVLYRQCLTVQNAARLAYPSTKAGNEEARARFLLDEFPPRGGASAGENPDPHGPTPPTPPAPPA